MYIGREEKEARLNFVAKNIKEVIEEDNSINHLEKEFINDELLKHKERIDSMYFIRNLNCKIKYNLSKKLGIKFKELETFLKVLQHM